jgi:hypothetical protein
VAGEEGELFGGGGDSSGDIFDEDIVSFVSLAVGEGVERFLEVSDGIGLGGLTDFWVDAADESDEVKGLFGAFSGEMDGKAVEEGGEDFAVGLRVKIEEGLGVTAEGRVFEFFGLTFLGKDLAELISELEMELRHEVERKKGDKREGKDQERR